MKVKTFKIYLDTEKPQRNSYISFIIENNEEFTKKLNVSNAPNLFNSKEYKEFMDKLDEINKSKTPILIKLSLCDNFSDSNPDLASVTIYEMGGREFLFDRPPIVECDDAYLSSFFKELYGLNKEVMGGGGYNSIGFITRLEELKRYIEGQVTKITFDIGK